MMKLIVFAAVLFLQLSSSSHASLSCGQEFLKHKPISVERFDALLALSASGREIPPELLYDAHRVKAAIADYLRGYSEFMLKGYESKLDILKRARSASERDRVHTLTHSGLIALTFLNMAFSAPELMLGNYSSGFAFLGAAALASSISGIKLLRDRGVMKRSELAPVIRLGRALKWSETERHKLERALETIAISAYDRGTRLLTREWINDLPYQSY